MCGENENCLQKMKKCAIIFYHTGFPKTIVDHEMARVSTIEGTDTLTK